MKIKPAELAELVELLARMLTGTSPAKSNHQRHEAEDAAQALRRGFERARAAEHARWDRSS